MVRFLSKFEGPWADPSEKMYIINTGEWRYQRPVTKASKCRQCGWCYIFCPTQCIREKGTSFTANLDYCKGCGVCAQICPANAIMMVREEE
ncbi:4Fe-4S binding protein [Chloroflexota bacterium]